MGTDLHRRRSVLVAIPRDSVIGGVKDAIIARRGKEARNIAKVAAARRLLTLVFYGMRDGQIRCCHAPARTRRQPARHGPHEQPYPWGTWREVAKHSARRQARGRKLFCPRPPGGRASI